MLSRRGFIGGLAGIIAAPAIVRAASIMPVTQRDIVTPVHDPCLVKLWSDWLVQRHCQSITESDVVLMEKAMLERGYERNRDYH